MALTYAPLAIGDGNLYARLFKYCMWIPDLVLFGVQSCRVWWSYIPASLCESYSLQSPAPGLICSRAVVLACVHVGTMTLGLLFGTSNTADAQFKTARVTQSVDVD